MGTALSPLAWWACCCFREDCIPPNHAGAAATQRRLRLCVRILPCASCVLGAVPLAQDKVSLTLNFSQHPALCPCSADR